MPRRIRKLLVTENTARRLAEERVPLPLTPVRPSLLELAAVPARGPQVALALVHHDEVALCLPRGVIERLVRQPRRWIYGAIAAALVAFIAGGGVGWLAHGVAASPSTFQNFTLDALDAHRLYVVEVRHPVEVPGSERAHLQQWLTKRCGWDVHAPELDATGLKLVGGRLLGDRLNFIVQNDAHVFVDVGAGPRSEFLRAIGF